ncbi:glutamate-5-semialdehyde dehydrogenase [Saitoella complicata NRRL Y-17804]|uniref:glutamate-5-semialdehyde dehydrogenase n=1 Tax=Saitoella complicata (strain BCRC 22490 / CBS 7301 / JCM 7358 / NBRC 10748 / NRRL Y-17804) TaxID=698492 RepID=UPI000867FE95|nr:glutamate-5-semialdehyde dehydrogenase [Saitoella complicata NRRL Y-17804]ODQ54881.1 glutamate-5-semialdehyde dehydrogenase [Saitoella complicata NRRL Y-17804]
MLQGILDVMNLEDPVGKVSLSTKLDEGLELHRLACPVGVLLVIFEARPEVIANITALALKSGNACILKGGKESSHSFAEIARVVSGALARTDNIPRGAVQLVQTRDEISALLKQDRDIDMVIPRGSNALVRNIKENTKIPVLGHADGLCSVYIHEDADVDMACRVVVDAKTHYPAACNAAETLVVNEKILTTTFTKVANALLDAKVSLRCDAASLAALNEVPALLAEYASQITASTPEDYDTEFLELIIAVKTVPSLPAAIHHINTHNSGHTDSILTSSAPTAQQFMSAIDAAGVYWNASTRFADGFRYGFGAEVGISTNKVHARGPVGLEGLMIYKYQVRGMGHVAGDFDVGGKRYLHEKIEGGPTRL